MQGQTHLEFGHICADLGDNAGDLVAWQARELGVFPLVEELVQVRVADAAVRDLQNNGNPLESSTQSRRNELAANS